ATSGYTYAIDLTPDEVLRSGEKVNGVDTALSAPAVFYLDNFLNFPVGTQVPSGFYDDDKGYWRPVRNGVVAKVVSYTGALANVDLTGDGVAETQLDLNKDGVADVTLEDGERQKIAIVYNVGDTFWRMDLPHLSAYDHNMRPRPPVPIT